MPTTVSMAPPRPRQSSPPISIPRAEHLPTPLSPSLRNQMSNHLVISGTIARLREAMDRSCHDAGWAQAVFDRSMQLLREGGLGDWKELEKALVREAMGMEEEEEEADDDDDHISGEDGREEDDGEDEGAAEGQKKQGGNGDGRRGTASVVKVADIEMPEPVKQEGWKIVRAGMEKANVVVKEELTDGWVV